MGARHTIGGVPKERAAESFAGKETSSSILEEKEVLNRREGKDNLSIIPRERLRWNH